jgi:hypothetical protein
MPVFDQLQRAAFDGLEFPIKYVSIKGRYRHEEHEYLRVPGAVIEKLERALYSIEMGAVFDTNIRGYGTLWPNTLAALRNKFEAGVTSALVVPTIGTVPAFQPEWDQTAEIGKIRSGEVVRLLFKEDQTQRFVTLALVKAQQQSLATAASNLGTVRASLADMPAQDISIFDAIQEGSNALLAFKDRADLVNGWLAAKIAQVTHLVRQADSALESMKDPVNHELLEAFMGLWNALVVMGTNLAESPRGPRLYTVPRQMSVSDIAVAVYGNTERASEILVNNNFADPFAVPAGEKVIYFVDGGLVAA